MASAVSMSWWGLLAILLAGCFVGWLLANVRITGALKISMARGEARTGKFEIRTVRIMQLRCQCGAVWKFRDGAAHSDPAYLPYPKGQSFTCPACGRAASLKVEHPLENDAISEVASDLKRLN
jgi:hypothetical protein